MQPWPFQVKNAFPGSAVSCDGSEPVFDVDQSPHAFMEAIVEHSPTCPMSIMSASFGSYLLRRFRW